MEPRPFVLPQGFPCQEVGENFVGVDGGEGEVLHVIRIVKVSFVGGGVPFELDFKSEGISKEINVPLDRLGGFPQFFRDRRFCVHFGFDVAVEVPEFAEDFQGGLAIPFIGFVGLGLFGLFFF